MYIFIIFIYAAKIANSRNFSTEKVLSWDRYCTNPGSLLHSSTQNMQ